MTQRVRIRVERRRHYGIFAPVVVMGQLMWFLFVVIYLMFKFVGIGLYLAGKFTVREVRRARYPRTRKAFPDWELKK